MTTNESGRHSPRRLAAALRDHVDATGTLLRASVRRADSWMERRHASRTDRLTYRMSPGLANAGVVGLGAGIIGFWVELYYARVGLDPGDAGPSLFWLVVIAVTMASIVIVLNAVLFWVLFRVLHIRGVVFLLHVVLLVGTVVAVGVITNSLMATLALLVAVAVLFVRSVRRTLVARHRVAFATKVLLGAVLIMAVLIAAPPVPLSYEQLAEGHPRSLTDSFLPLPDGFVLDTSRDMRRPLVVLDRAAWMTVIDPCEEPPYEKELVRFDAVELKSSSLQEAMAFCSSTTP